MLSVNFYRSSVFPWFAFRAGPQDEGSIFRNFGDIAFTELIVRADFNDLESFLDDLLFQLKKEFLVSVLQHREEFRHILFAKTLNK